MRPGGGGDTGPAPTEAAPPQPPPSRGARLWTLARRLMPWASLAVAVASAVLMDRRPGRAWIVAAAAGSGWLLVSTFAALGAIDPERLGRRRRFLAKAARASAAWGAQAVMQLCLFFSAPFYARALAVPAHAPFLGLIAVAAAVTAWDPAYARVIQRPAGAALLQAVAAFAGLDCVLPLLGLSGRASLLAAAAGAAAGTPFVVGGSARRRVAAAVLVAAAVAVAGFAGVARLVPPAPLRFVSGGIGTRVVERELVDPTEVLAAPPERLVCWSAIAAPRGLRDRLRHVWRQDGVVRAELTLALRGGRAQGFRAWSFKRAVTPGRWTCTVETDSGQVLGRRAVTVGRAR